MRIDPQETLTQGNKRRHMLNPVGSKVLQLHLIVIQQPPKESMRRYCKSSLMKDGERYDIPFERHRLTLVTRYQPLLDGGQWTEKATTDEALQTPRRDARSAPQLH